MNKKELITAVADRNGMTKKDTAVFLDTLRDVVYDTLAAGDEVSLIDGLKLYVKDTGTRNGRNPQTGEPLVIPAHKTVGFKRGHALKTLFD